MWQPFGLDPKDAYFMGATRSRHEAAARRTEKGHWTAELLAHVRMREAVLPFPGLRGWKRMWRSLSISLIDPHRHF
jgi:hypothetical protein